MQRTARYAAMLFVAVVAAGCVGSDFDRTESLQEAEHVVSRWLAAAVDASEPGRGYEFLHPKVRDEISMARYQRAVRNAREVAGSILPETGLERSEVGEFYDVSVSLEGGSASLPDSLQELGLVQPLVRDADDIGVVVIVKVDDQGIGIWRPG